jgi:hypothetical protein
MHVIITVFESGDGGRGYTVEIEICAVPDITPRGSRSQKYELGNLSTAVRTAPWQPENYHVRCYVDSIGAVVERALTQVKLGAISTSTDLLSYRYVW